MIGSMIRVLRAANLASTTSMQLHAIIFTPSNLHRRAASHWRRLGKSGRIAEFGDAADTAGKVVVAAGTNLLGEPGEHDSARANASVSILTSIAIVVLCDPFGYCGVVCHPSHSQGAP